jgi:hypothetical protein
MIVGERSVSADAGRASRYRTHFPEAVYLIVTQTAGFSAFVLLSGEPDEDGFEMVDVGTRNEPATRESA